MENMENATEHMEYEYGEHGARHGAHYGEHGEHMWGTHQSAWPPFPTHSHAASASSLPLLLLQEDAEHTERISGHMENGMENVE